MCVYTYICIFVCVPLGVHRCSFGGLRSNLGVIPQKPSLPLLARLVLWDMNLVQSAKLVDQGAPGTQLSLLLSVWKTKHCYVFLIPILLTGLLSKHLLE